MTENENDAGRTDDQGDEAPDYEDPDQDFGPPGGGRMRAPRARIEGTQMPTKMPDCLSSRNQRPTEKRNERKAATRTRIRAFFT